MQKLTRVSPQQETVAAAYKGNQAAAYKGNQAFVWLFKVNALILCSCFWQEASFCEFYSLLKLQFFLLRINNTIVVDIQYTVPVLGDFFWWPSLISESGPKYILLRVGGIHFSMDMEYRMQWNINLSGITEEEKKVLVRR